MSFIAPQKPAATRTTRSLSREKRCDDLRITESRIVVEVVLAGTSRTSRQRLGRIAEVDAQHVVWPGAEPHVLSALVPHELHITQDDVDVGPVSLLSKR